MNIWYVEASILLHVMHVKLHVNAGIHLLLKID